MLSGLIANRWHTTLLAFTQPLSTSPALTDPLVSPYTPAWTEWATAIGVVSILTLIFSFGMRYLPAFRGTPVADPEPEPPAAEAVADVPASPESAEPLSA